MCGTRPCSGLGVPKYPILIGYLVIVWVVADAHLGLVRCRTGCNLCTVRFQFQRGYMWTWAQESNSFFGGTRTLVRIPKYGGIRQSLSNHLLVGKQLICISNVHRPQKLSREPRHDYSEAPKVSTWTRRASSGAPFSRNPLSIAIRRPWSAPRDPQYYVTMCM